MIISRLYLFIFQRLKATLFLHLVLYTCPMKTVYVDDMFLLNLIINYLVLLATGKLCCLPLKRVRFGLAAALGALYSVAVLLPPLRFLASPLTKLSLGVLMTLLAFGGEKNLVKPFFAFLAVSAAFGGAVFAASMLAGNSISAGLYINASLKVLILSFAVCYCVLTIVFNRFAAKRRRETASVNITLCGKSAEFTALFDTGNELYDPISGLPVMVVGISAAQSLLPEDSISALNRGAAEFIVSLAENDDLKTRFRLVPFTAVGVQNSMLPVFKPDKATVNGKENQKLLVGLSPTKICSDNEFSAVI